MRYERTFIQCQKQSLSLDSQQPTEWFFGGLFIFFCTFGCWLAILKIHRLKKGTSQISSDPHSIVFNIRIVYMLIYGTKATVAEEAETWSRERLWKWSAKMIANNTSISLKTKRRIEQIWWWHNKQHEIGITASRFDIHCPIQFDENNDHRTNHRTNNPNEIISIRKSSKSIVHEMSE